MKKLKRKFTRTDAGVSRQTRLSFINELVRRRRNEAGAGILALVVLHFVSQFIFFPEENFLSRKPDLETKSEQVFEVKTEAQAAQPNEAARTDTTPSRAETAKPVARPIPKTVPTQTTIKKKESRESRAQRLKRAERILTGA